MIPKIIHYIWLGGQDYPPTIQHCIDSWKRLMPDFEFMLWNDETIKDINIIFVKEAVAAKKYAFASDVIRLWALAKYGGVYLDTDVMVFKSFLPLLSHRAFIGREACMQINYHTTSYHLTSYCLGAEKENSFILKCLSYYEGRHFLTSTNEQLPNSMRFDMKNASSIYSEVARLCGYNPSTLAPNEQTCENGNLVILPPETFAESGNEAGAFCRHMSIGSWRDTISEEEIYTLGYKIKWRVKACVETVLRHFGYIMIKQN